MSESNKKYEGALDWDSEIEESYIDLPDGDYNYKVVGLEKQQYEPKATSKIKDPCHMVLVSVEVDGGDEGNPRLDIRLILHSKTQGLLTAFFRSIGTMKKGDKLKMNWNIQGKTGKLRIKHEDYNGNSYMKIDRFLPMEEQKEEKLPWE